MSYLHAVSHYLPYAIKTKYGPSVFNELSLANREGVEPSSLSRHAFHRLRFASLPLSYLSIMQLDFTAELLTTFI